MSTFGVSEALSVASIERFSKSNRFTRFFQAVVRVYRVERRRRALSELSDRTLKDIGVARSEIDYIAGTMADGGRGPAPMPPSLWVQG